MEALILVQRVGGPTMLARMLRTLSRHLPTAIKPAAEGDQRV